MDFFKLRLWMFLVVIGCSADKNTNNLDKEINKAVSKNVVCSQLIKVTKNKSVCSPSEKFNDSIKINLSHLSDSVTQEQLLDVRSNKYFPDIINQISEVDLSHNLHIYKIPSFVFQLPQLRSLNISHTSIRGWDEEMCQLENLKLLLGSHNTYQGKEIPFHTFCLKSLESLDMSDSNIAYIDEYIGELKNLKELHLQNNQITIVPLMIETIPDLVLVDFRNNLFLDEDISDLHDCINIDKDDKEDCKEDFLDTMSCTFHYDIPITRGEPLRKMYTDLSGQNLDEFQSVDATPTLDFDMCYKMWVGFLIDHEDPEILNKTIKDKTLRELKYMSDYQHESKGMSCYPIFFRPDNAPHKPRAVGGQGFEIRPEKFRFISKAKQFQGRLDGDPEFWIPSTKDTPESPAQCPHLDGMNLVEKIREQITYN